MKPITLGVLSLALAMALPAHANLTVHPMRTSVEVKKGTNIRVYSQSTQPQFVQASIRRIDNAAQADENEVEVEPAEAAIAITPGKFALAGGGNRLIRVIPLQPVSRETAYRVYFEGVPGPEHSPIETHGPDAQANVGVSLVWGALVNVLPDDGTVDVHVDGNQLHNTGTLRLGITSVSDCQGDRCTSHDVSQSLYPGGALELPFVPTAGSTVQLRYRLTRDGYREHVQSFAL
ncbi:TPA: fimbria/pilus periplasmic chaperone [Stenotrophomonas maltophilia]|nr:fimbria/pilus periplasmic chaperone [Stenotrophomonas maltophilia]HDS1043492.1 fimbria/pilus periplasmic chaperone [Stenotrophomonas maltophilia]